MRFLAFAIGLLALGPQVVRSASFKFSFDGNVTQCQPVSISFSGVDHAKGDPVSLTLIPFNSHPFSIPLPEATANSSGVAVTFLPLKADQLFVASMDDEEGDNTSKVSDIFKVFPSDNASCIPSTEDSQFTLPKIVSQCETFNVNYTTPEAPIIRTFEPKDGSSEMQKVFDDPVQKTAQYMMKGKRGDQIVLVAFENTTAMAEGTTSDLITISGDASSSTSCFNDSDDDDNDNGNSSGSSNSDTKSGSASSVPKGVIIGLSVGGGLVALIAMVMALYLIRDRRRKRDANRIVFDPALLEKRGQKPDSYHSERAYTPDVKVTFSQTPHPYSGYALSGLDSSGFVRNPPYTATEKFDDDDGANSVSSVSWVPVLARGQSARTVAQSVAKQSSRLSINPYDIERMLDYAQDPSSPPAVSIIGTDSGELVPPPRRTPSDIPYGPHSVTLDSGSLMNSSIAASQGHNAGNLQAPYSPGGFSASTRLSELSFSDNIIQIPQPAVVAAASTLSIPATNLTSRFSAYSAPSDVADAEDGASGIGGFPRPKPSNVRSPLGSESSVRDSGESWGNIRSPR